jgi:hypothetical protein
MTIPLARGAKHEVVNSPTAGSENLHTPSRAGKYHKILSLILWRLFLSRTNMPRFKVLKGVAHNIGHSFTSLMNYSVDDYSMGHILRYARETEIDTLVLDFVIGQATRQACYVSQFPNCQTGTQKCFGV